MSQNDINTIICVTIDTQRKALVSWYNFVFNTAPGDGPTPASAKISAGTVIAKFGS